jgi:two-component system chemotaxis response regulator CheB
MNRTDPPHRLVVIGASAGGPTTLRTLVSALDPQLSAALLVVQYLAPESPRLLPAVLEQAGSLPITFAQDGGPVVAGQIVLAPPDHHLAVQPQEGRAVFCA